MARGAPALRPSTLTRPDAKCAHCCSETLVLFSVLLPGCPCLFLEHSYKPQPCWFGERGCWASPDCRPQGRGVGTGLAVGAGTPSLQHAVRYSWELRWWSVKHLLSTRWVPGPGGVGPTHLLQGSPGCDCVSPTSALPLWVSHGLSDVDPTRGCLDVTTSARATALSLCVWAQAIG